MAMNAASRAPATLTVPAPAKINLFLHVTGRRADGYHTLESLMVLLDHGDTVSLVRRDDGRIARARGLPGIPAETDLAVRAARALKEATGTPFGVDLDLVKRIPQGGGLGGGSSDAASVLLALNRMWGLDLPRERLQAIGATLGADVPFFVFGAPALARGAGERLTAMTVPQRFVAVVVPPVAVPTAAVFAAPELTRNARSAKMEVFSEAYGRNDLAAVAVARFPAVAEALRALSRVAVGPVGARMTGSVGCVYALFDTGEAARAALSALPAGTRGFVGRTLARHPLAGFA
jgi:4-diphosphocytidyl-2-C-methyl-D-erythritol kinase